eukprot:258178-Pelagomonas_calceolata.AAC.2
MDATSTTHIAFDLYMKASHCDTSMLTGPGSLLWCPDDSNRLAEPRRGLAHVDKAVLREAD